jgi:PAS domain S-box-containing protein
MNFEDVIRVFATHVPIGVVLTDAALERPGPIIRYANPAFCRLTGYAAEELVGASPRVVQGQDTQPLILRDLARTLKSGRRFHGVLFNYRKSGAPYLCEIDVRPVYDTQGRLDSFIAFEREVIRARGRPARDGGLSRFKPVIDEDALLRPLLPGLSPFSP